MNPAIVFLALLIGAPLAELYVLIEVGSQIGALSTILISIFTAVLGAWLVRMQGLAVLFRVQQSLARGEPPALELMEGALLLVAGLVLLFPGFITDALGFLLLVPPLRRGLILRWLRRQDLLRPAPGAPSDAAPQRRVEVIEGEFRREEDR